MTKTEMRNPKTTHIDKMNTIDMLKVFQEENYVALKALDNALESIAPVIDVIAEKIKIGGRLIYVGCGTSGRLGVLDASECPPTFGVTPDVVIGIIAGGDKCLRSAAEGAEDSGEAGIEDIASLNPTENDCIVGISVAGEAQYVLKALEYSKQHGSTTIGLTSNKGSSLAKTSDFAIVTDTGAEVVTGSTRLKAGTAHKLVLNMLSTCAMIKQGYVYENLMINLRPTNIKLKARTIRIVSDITGTDIEYAEKLLSENEWNIKKAVQSYKQ